MNKLLKPALLAQAAALTIIFISCSGSDGRDGSQGAQGAAGTWSGCTAELSEDGSQAVVKCGEAVIGTLTEGAAGVGGAEGPTPFCTAAPKANGSGYTITCVGKPPFDISNGAGAGSAAGDCLLKDSKGLLTISCGSGSGAQSFRLTLCGGDGEETLGRTFNENTHFCSTDYPVEEPVVEMIVPRCGASRSSYDINESYCARSLVMELERSAGKALFSKRTIAGAEVASDRLADAFYKDINPETPPSANWKVLAKGICFAGSSTKTCLLANAVKLTTLLSDSVKTWTEKNSVSEEDEDKESMVEVNFASTSFGDSEVYGCGSARFYDVSTGACILPDEAGKGCGSIMKNSNTCYSGSVPQSQASNVYIKSCKPAITGLPGTVNDGKVWYNGSDANIASCDVTRDSYEQAFRCAGNRIVSTYQVATNFIDGSTYDMKVSCYTVSDPSECEAKDARYVTSGQFAGQCGLIAGVSDVPVCPSGYRLNDKKYYSDICAAFIKGATVWGVSDGIDNATGNGAKAPHSYIIASASKYTAASFERDFARACVNDTVPPASGSAKPTVYDCEFKTDGTNLDEKQWSAANSSASGKWSVRQPSASSVWTASRGTYNATATTNFSGQLVMEKAISICKSVQKAYFDARHGDGSGSFCVQDVTSESCGIDGAIPSTSPKSFGLCAPGGNKSVPVVLSGYSVKYALNGAGDAFELNANTDMCSAGSALVTSGGKKICVLNSGYDKPTCPVGYTKDTKGSFCYQNITARVNCPPGYSYSAATGLCSSGAISTEPACAYGGEKNSEAEVDREKNTRCEIALAGTESTYCAKGSTVSADGLKCELVDENPTCLHPSSLHYDVERIRQAAEVAYDQGTGKCVIPLAAGTGEGGAGTPKRLNKSGSTCYQGPVETTDPLDVVDCDITPAGLQYDDGTACYLASKKEDYGTALDGTTGCKNPLADSYDSVNDICLEDDGLTEAADGCTLAYDYEDGTNCWIGGAPIDIPAAFVGLAGVTTCTNFAEVGIIPEVPGGAVAFASPAVWLCGSANDVNGFKGYKWDEGAQPSVCEPAFGSAPTPPQSCAANAPTGALLPGFKSNIATATTYATAGYTAGDLTVPAGSGILDPKEGRISWGSCGFMNDAKYCPSNKVEGTTFTGNTSIFKAFTCSTPGDLDLYGSCGNGGTAAKWDNNACALKGTFNNPQGSALGCAKTGALYNGDTKKCEALL
jgi:hypothetical protein